MASKMSLDMSDFEKQMLKKLNELQADVPKIVTKALEKTHEIVTEKALEAMKKENLPAKGKFSSSATEASILREAKVYGIGEALAVDVGFSIGNGGLASIFLLYGTPRMKKSQKLYDAFFSNATKSEVLTAQEQIIFNELQKIKG